MTKMQNERLFVAHIIPRLIWEIPMHIISPWPCPCSSHASWFSRCDHWPGLLSVEWRGKRGSEEWSASHPLPSADYLWQVSRPPQPRWRHGDNGILSTGRRGDKVNAASQLRADFIHFSLKQWHESKSVPWTHNLHTHTKDWTNVMTCTTARTHLFSCEQLDIECVAVGRINFPVAGEPKCPCLPSYCPGTTHSSSKLLSGGLTCGPLHWPIQALCVQGSPSPLEGFTWLDQAHPGHL